MNTLWYFIMQVLVPVAAVVIAITVLALFIAWWVSKVVLPLAQWILT